MLKKFLMYFALIIGLASCGNGVNTANAKSPEKDRVEVIYFHGKQRCATCMAIEKNTKEVLETVFADEIKDGKIVFRTVDISTPDGEAIADRYEVAWSSLFVNKWRDGKETRNNLTKFGFGTALKNPDVFKTGLEETIRESLK